MHRPNHILFTAAELVVLTTAAGEPLVRTLVDWGPRDRLYIGPPRLFPQDEKRLRQVLTPHQQATQWPTFYEDVARLLVVWAPQRVQREPFNVYGNVGVGKQVLARRARNKQLRAMWRAAGRLAHAV